MRLFDTADTRIVSVVVSVTAMCCCLSLSLRTEVIIYLVERSPNGTSKRIPATTLSSFLEQNNIKTQLTQLGVLMSVTRTELSPAQLKQLLQNAPAGGQVTCQNHVFNVRISWLEMATDVSVPCHQGWTQSFGSRPRWTTLNQTGKMLYSHLQMCTAVYISRNSR